MEEITHSKAGFDWLQWGRDREVADRTDAKSKSTTSESFNGAATARSPIVEPHVVRVGGSAGLQWGRDREVADSGERHPA